ncbi:MAG: hypothetical protein QOG83_1651, partial [Alphaproteobacteria bacterium]|nr:hypothetical protein [Alphaproteobacteria bacterium]
DAPPPGEPAESTMKPGGAHMPAPVTGHAIHRILPSPNSDFSTQQRDRGEP